MLDFGTKVDNNPTDSSGNLTATEFNNYISELENAVTTSGISLDTGGTDLFQLAKAIATYAVSGNFYLDSGTVNLVTLTPPGTRKAPASYVDGFRARFFPANTNTGATNVNIATLGSKAIKRVDGSDLSAGDLQAGAETEIVYRVSLDYFIVSQNVKVTGNQNISGVKTFATAPQGGTDPSVGNDLVRYSYLQTYVAANSNSFIPGMVMAWPGATAPSGWVFCYGQAISRTTYATLFTNIGSTWGSGDGTTTFNVPDFRGRFLGGKDNMGGSAVNRITLNGTTLGAVGGEEYHTLTVTEMPAHTHDISYFSGTEPGNNRAVLGGGNITTSGSTGGGTGHNNMPPYAIVNYIIKT